MKTNREILSEPFCGCDEPNGQRWHEDKPGECIRCHKPILTKAYLIKIITERRNNMRRLLIAVTVVMIMAAPALAGRVEDMQKERNELLNERGLLTEKILRIEGALMERELIEREQAELLEPAPIGAKAEAKSK